MTLARQVRWTVCAKLHGRTRKRDSRRCCTMSMSTGSGRPIGAPHQEDAVLGVDGVTWGGYGQDLEANLSDLHARLHRGAYRGESLSKGVHPKARRAALWPLGIATLEDKIVQRAVVEVLNAIYEEDFLGVSYGFRPGRSPHDALDALAVGIEKQEAQRVLTRTFVGFTTPSTTSGSGVGRAPDRGQAGPAAHPEVAERRSDRGRVMVGQAEVGSLKGAVHRPCSRTITLHYVFERTVGTDGGEGRPTVR